ncbi:uncharacterized protein LOC131016229 [Salvia miltiorrhiza]|uniref:uncharacterized protein LOC131016229 n=1 Tax=Salvia miltiorrhiza TaxID=226208 RepID=UPI0025AB71C3|nr:uncharacterized protein LOC131016229 [Salvia miltiorrhiza]
MATSVESPSPASLHTGHPISMVSSPPLFSPSSDKRFWSALTSRVDTLLENQRPKKSSEAVDRAKRLKEDSMLLLRGFDSVAQSLSQLSNNLETALEGARSLAKPPPLSEILHATIEKAKDGENPVEEESKGEKKQEDDNIDNRGLKRKLDSGDCNDDQDQEEGEENSQEGKRKGSKEMEKIKKAKNLAITMATRAASMARELKSIRSDMAFMQERCGLLEEENRKLRDGLAEGTQPDDDDLVRLQLEALLAEKSRLANENANLTRENQCLHQLVEYHQLTSQDLSSSYESLLRGMQLDFSSPQEGDEDEDGGSFNREFRTPHADILGFSKSLDECFDEELEE